MLIETEREAGNLAFTSVMEDQINFMQRQMEQAANKKLTVQNRLTHLQVVWQHAISLLGEGLILLAGDRKEFFDQELTPEMLTMISQLQRLISTLNEKEITWKDRFFRSQAIQNLAIDLAIYIESQDKK